MNQLSWRTQIAMLWLLQVVNFVAIMLITYFETGLVTGEEPAAIVPAVSVYFFLFAALIWAAFGLPAAIGRWVHVVFGVFAVLVKGMWVISGVTGGSGWPFLLNEVWGLAAAVLLVWVAWKLPKADE